MIEIKFFVVFDVKIYNVKGDYTYISRKMKKLIIQILLKKS